METITIFDVIFCFFANTNIFMNASYPVDLPIYQSSYTIMVIVCLKIE